MCITFTMCINICYIAGLVFLLLCTTSLEKVLHFLEARIQDPTCWVGVIDWIFLCHAVISDMLHMQTCMSFSSLLRIVQSKLKLSIDFNLHELFVRNTRLLEIWPFPVVSWWVFQVEVKCQWSWAICFLAAQKITAAGCTYVYWKCTWITIALFIVVLRHSFCWRPITYFSTFVIHPVTRQTMMPHVNDGTWQNLTQ